MKSVNFTDTFCVGKLLSHVRRDNANWFSTHTPRTRTHTHAHAHTPGRRVPLYLPCCLGLAPGPSLGLSLTSSAVGWKSAPQLASPAAALAMVTRPRGWEVGPRFTVADGEGPQGFG